MILREAGLVEDHREGARIYYRVTRPQVFELVKNANQMGGVKPGAVTRGKVPNCPCPSCNPPIEETENVQAIHIKVQVGNE